MADKSKFAEWSRTNGVVRAGREQAVATASDARGSEWTKCTAADPNRGTVRRGRAKWAKQRLLTSV
jgi:hypothetical protein